MATKKAAKVATAAPSLDYVRGVVRGLLFEVERDIESHNDFQLTYGGPSGREYTAKDLGVPVLVVDCITRNVMPADLRAWMEWEHRDEIQKLLEEAVKDEDEEGWSDDGGAGPG